MDNDASQSEFKDTKIQFNSIHIFFSKAVINIQNRKKIKNYIKKSAIKKIRVLINKKSKCVREWTNIKAVLQA